MIHIKTMDLSITTVMEMLSKDPTSPVIERISIRSHSTPLMDAIVANRFKDVATLLGYKANVNARNECGNTPIVLACMKEQGDLVIQLVHHGADINTVNVTGMTPLMLAISKYISMVPVLLNMGASVYQKDISGNTPLNQAVGLSRWECIGPLISFGSNPYEPNEIGINAFQKAVLLDHALCLQQLVNRTFVHEQPLYSTLIESAIEHKHNECLSHLIIPGMNRKMLNHMLLYAVEKQNLYAMKMLMMNGADPDEMDWGQRTPMVWGAIHQNQKIIQLCLDHGAKLHISSAFVMSILCIYGNLQLVRFMLSKGARVNEEYQNSPPLMKAAKYGHEEIVHVLIQSGADVNYINHCKKSCADVARHNKFKKCALVIERCQSLSKLPYTHDMIPEMMKMNITRETWLSALSGDAYRRMIHTFEECHTDEKACFVALYEGEDRLMRKYRNDEKVIFSNSWLRGFVRPLLNRRHATRMVEYLVHPFKVRQCLREVEVYVKGI